MGSAVKLNSWWVTWFRPVSEKLNPAVARQSGARLVVCVHACFTFLHSLNRFAAVDAIWWKNMATRTTHCQVREANGFLPVQKRKRKRSWVELKVSKVILAWNRFLYVCSCVKIATINKGVDCQQRCNTQCPERLKMRWQILDLCLIYSYVWLWPRWVPKTADQALYNLR